MSWSVSGTVQGNAGESGFEDTFGTPPEADEQLAQYDFLRDMISDAFEAGVLHGKYSVNLSGHDDPSVAADRKSIGFVLSPIT